MESDRRGDGEASGGDRLLSTYAARNTRIGSGYMGQLIEWPEVITQGRTLEECREMPQDALHEMILAYRQQKKQFRLEEPCWSKFLFNQKIVLIKRHRTIDRITANDYASKPD